MGGLLVGCRDLGEALRRVCEGATMIRTKGEAGTGNVVEVVRHVRSVMWDIRVLRNMDGDEVFAYAKCIAMPYDLVMQTVRVIGIIVFHIVYKSTYRQPRWHASQPHRREITYTIKGTYYNYIVLTLPHSLIGSMLNV